MVLAPPALELFTIINLTTAIALAMLALSLALVWGYGGHPLLRPDGVLRARSLRLHDRRHQLRRDSTWAILAAVLVAAAFAVPHSATSCSTDA